MHNIWLFDLLLCCPSTQFHFEGPVCQAIARSDNNSTINFFKTYSRTQTQHSYSKFRMQGFFSVMLYRLLQFTRNITTYGCVICVVLPFNTVSFRRSSLPGYRQKVTIILQAISSKLIQTRSTGFSVRYTAACTSRPSQFYFTRKI